MRLNEKDSKIFYRCQTCGRLVGNKNLELCAGHHMKQGYYASFFEWLMIKIGVYK